MVWWPRQAVNIVISLANPLTSPMPPRYGGFVMDEQHAAAPVVARANATVPHRDTWSFDVAYYWYFTTPPASLAGREAV
jgi:hypothetical protein